MRRLADITNKRLTKLGNALIARIKRRSTAGRDANRKLFRRKKDGTRSNITDTGQLLNSITSSLSNGVIKIFPTVNYADDVQRTRPFMGLNATDKKVIEKEVQRIIKDAEKVFNKKNSKGESK